MPARLRLFGAGVRAQVVIDLVAWQLGDAFVVEGAYDDAKAPGTRVRGVPVLGPVEQGLHDAARDPGCQFLVAFGSRGRFRACELFMRLRGVGAPLATLVAPGASVAPSARVGAGAVVLPNAFLGCDVEAGELCFVHAGATVEHHSRLGRDVLAAPGASVASGVRVGDHCFLGVGSAVAPECEVGTGTVVGAGAVVVRSHPPHAVVYGNPARVRRPVAEGDEVLTRAELEALNAAGWSRVPGGAS
jgi:sugar O-acyltransferase (sialic acid O-acetyltransferase NeuD family)